METNDKATNKQMKFASPEEAIPNLAAAIQAAIGSDSSDEDESEFLRQLIENQKNIKSMQASQHSQTNNNNNNNNNSQNQSMNSSYTGGLAIGEVSQNLSQHNLQQKQQQYSESSNGNAQSATAADPFSRNFKQVTKSAPKEKKKKAQQGSKSNSTALSLFSDDSFTSSRSRIDNSNSNAFQDQQSNTNQNRNSINKGNSSFAENPFPLLEVPENENDLVISSRKLKEVESFFADQSTSDRNILFLYGNSGVGKKTVISYLVQHQLRSSILYLHRFKKLDQSAATFSWNGNGQESDDENDDYAYSNSANNSMLENPVDLLIYALNRSLCSVLFKNEVVIMQELPDGLKFAELKRISDYLKQRYAVPTRTRKNPIIFILNTSIFNQRQVHRIFRDNCPEFFLTHVREITIPNPTEREIRIFSRSMLRREEKAKHLTESKISAITQDIALTSNGDLCNAQLQIRMLLSSHLFNSTSSLMRLPKITATQPSGSTALKPANNKSEKQKDNEFTIFHTLGKFLYNKRLMIGFEHEEPKQMTKQQLLSGQTTYYFDPMNLILQINCSQPFFRGALQQNYLDFYKEISEVTEQANVFAELDILESLNFQEKNEIAKEDNEYLFSLLAGEGVMMNNLSGSEVKRKYTSIVKNQQGDLENERKVRMQAFRRSFPFISPRKYVQEYNHHFMLNPKIIACDMVKLKGSWKNQQQIEQTSQFVDDPFKIVQRDTTSTPAGEQQFDDEMVEYDPNNRQGIATHFPKDQLNEYIEDDIEEC